MKYVVIILMVFGAIAPNTAFSQNNNRISIQTGLFHCYFDKTPLLNTNYPNKAIKPFKGLFYNSLSIQYQRRINTKSRISIEWANLSEGYRNVDAKHLVNVVDTRYNNNTFNITYSRNIQLVPKLEFTYGAGLNFTCGLESVLVRWNFFKNWTESIVETRLMRDVGLNIRTGIEYSPLKWLTLYTKFNLIGFMYLNDREQIHKIREWSKKNYPSHYDLSWRFGIGFNFGK